MFKWTPGILRRALNLYGPYLGAGVKVEKISSDWLEIQVSMALRWYNRNAVGTHFGGSLYSMIDPHLMLMLMQLLGNGYVVWDKAAAIEFISPGRGRVHARILITPEQLREIREQAESGKPYLPEFELKILDESGQIVARVIKTLYIRKKIAKSPVEDAKPVLKEES
jgi:acyl-coenzyme A thioesterase PaaI-like protein